MIKFTGINHMAMVTADMDATIHFWRDLLGMRLVAGLGRPGYRHYFFEVTEHDMIAFFEWPDVEKLPEKDHGAPVTGPFGFDHVSFEVAADDDLWELKARLEAADIWVSEVVDHGFIHSIYAFDPNRIPIEFSAPVPGVDMAGPSLVIAPDGEVLAETTEALELVTVSTAEIERARRDYPGYLPIRAGRYAGGWRKLAEGEPPVRG